MRMGEGEIVSKESNVIGYQRDIFGEEVPVEDDEETDQRKIVAIHSDSRGFSYRVGERYKNDYYDEIIESITRVNEVIEGAIFDRPERRCDGYKVRMVGRNSNMHWDDGDDVEVEYALF